MKPVVASALAILTLGAAADTVTLTLNGVVTHVNGDFTDMPSLAGVPVGASWSISTTYDPALPPDYDGGNVRSWLVPIQFQVGGVDLTLDYDGEAELMVLSNPFDDTLEFVMGSGPRNARVGAGFAPGALAGMLPGTPGPLPFDTGGMVIVDENSVLQGSLESIVVIPAPATLAAGAAVLGFAARRRRPS